MGSGTACLAGADSRRQSACVDARPPSRVAARHPGAGGADSPPPDRHEFLCGVRASVGRQYRRQAARGRARPKERLGCMKAREGGTRNELGFLDPAILARLGTLELKARTVVE